MSVFSRRLSHEFTAIEWWVHNTFLFVFVKISQVTLVVARGSRPMDLRVQRPAVSPAAFDHIHPCANGKTINAKQPSATISLRMCSQWRTQDFILGLYTPLSAPLCAVSRDVVPVGIGGVVIAIVIGQHLSCYEKA